MRISDRIRAKVKLIQHNLLDDAAPLGVFDIIFCRNVISGFERNLAGAVLDRLSDQLADDGYLVLGANETPAFADAPFAPTGKSGGVFTRARATRRAA